MDDYDEEVEMIEETAPVCSEQNPGLNVPVVRL